MGSSRVEPHGFRWTVLKAAGLLSKDVRNRIRILWETNKQKSTQAMKKTLSQNENRYIASTKMIQPLRKLALYKAPNRDAF